MMQTRVLDNPSSPGDDIKGWSLKAYLAGVLGAWKKSAADRSLRRQLLGLDDAILRDIGIADDEIWRVRRGDAFTPRAWM